MKIAVIKKKDDPIALRISIGGNFDAAYITYRGNIDEIKMLLTKVTQEFTKLQKEPEVSPDDGKKYA